MFQRRLREVVGSYRLKPRFELLEERRVLATVTWDGGAGTFEWGDDLNWSTDTQPGVSDDVIIANIGSPVAVNVPVDVATIDSQVEIVMGGLTPFQVGSGNFAGGFSVTASNAVNLGNSTIAGGTWNSATVNGVITNTGLLSFPGLSVDFGQITNQGTMAISTNTTGTLINQAGATIEYSGGTHVGSINNSGDLNSNGSVVINAALDNSGNVNVLGNTLTIGGAVTQYVGNTLTAGTWIANDGILDIAFSGTNITTLGPAASVSLIGSSASFDRIKTVNTNQGTFQLINHAFLGSSGAGFTNSGTVVVDGGSYAQSVAIFYDQVGGTTTLRNAAGFSASVTVDGGVFGGSGTVSGFNFTNNAIVAPGQSPGILNITGNYIQNASGTLQIEVQGTNAATPEFDQLIVNLNATLDGTLSVTQTNGFIADRSETFRIIQATGGLSGDFATKNVPQRNGLNLISTSPGANFYDLQGTAHVVRNTADTGAFSLRDQIANTNASPGLDQILFNVNAAGVQTLAPASFLGGFIEPIIIDGTSQAGYAGTPLIEINGAGAGAFNPGILLSLGSDGSTIKGLAVNSFADSGFFIQSLNNTISDNFIGTDPLGTIDLGNAQHGIIIQPGSTGNLIRNNLVSGNNITGITLVGNNNTVQGNKVGTNLAGSAAILNSTGVYVVSATGNTIGGSNVGEGNLISGNTGAGIELNVSANGNTVAGNLIGTTLNGLLALPNGGGVAIANSSNNNTIGGTTDGARNIISGNTYGLTISAAGTGNSIAGNYIGTDITGTADLGNTVGVLIDGASPNNVIGGALPGSGNVISGNETGVLIDSGISGNQIKGNLIGTDFSGTTPIGNSLHGIFINNASNNVVGGLTEDERNVISGNFDGLIVMGPTSTNNTIVGNFIGTDVTGTVDLGNSRRGVHYAGNNNTLGGTTVAERNVISGNNGPGIYLAATSNTIQGNHIGVDVTGLVSLGNSRGIEIVNGSTGNFIGGFTSIAGTGAGNIISGNGSEGVHTIGSLTNGNFIRGNLIGLASDGSTVLANGSYGVTLTGGTTNNLIGGDDDDDGALDGDVQARNIISGNEYGVVIAGAGIGNRVQGNYVGTARNGSIAKANTLGGLSLTGIAGATIGGTSAGAGNVISGNAGPGVYIIGGGLGATNIEVQGNIIGLNKDGSAAIGNTRGVTIENGAISNTIGGTAAGAGNIISGNSNAGVNFSGASTSGNQVIGNIIGTNASNAPGLGNAVYGVLLDGANNNQIGGNSAAARNLISGNDAGWGVWITGGSQGTQVQGNWIGTDSTGGASLPNGGGLYINGSPNNTIGGSGPNEGNVIAGNTGSGVFVSQASSVGNQILGNTIGLNSLQSGNLGNGDSGVQIVSAVNTIVGGAGNSRNVISGNDYGVSMVLSSGTQVLGNWIGLSGSGLTAIGNTLDGIYVGGGFDNSIGGLVAGQGNVISGQGRHGVTIENSDVNFVQGNIIGLASDGTTALGNAQHGVFLSLLSQGNVLGADDDDDGSLDGAVTGRNIISSNGLDGIFLSNQAGGSRILGNYIGTDRTGTLPRGNERYGIQDFGAADTYIGAGSPGAGNVISDNGNPAYGALEGGGIKTYGWQGVVQGNTIGLDASGNAVVGSQRNGVEILGDENVIGGTVANERNVISGNLNSGLHINGLAATLNEVLGNYIGLGADGTTVLGNNNGVLISDAPRNYIGGGVPGAGNVISGNGGDVAVIGAGAMDNRIQGNSISFTADGSSLIAPSLGYGVYVALGASDTIIGTDSDSANDATEGNLIGFASTAAVFLQDNGAAPNRTVIAGNTIGLGPSGAVQSTGVRGVWIAGATNTRIGSDSDGTSDSDERNVIVPNANSAIGILLTGGSLGATTGTIIAGNYVGLDTTGEIGLSNNTNGGILLQAAVGNGISNTMIGGIQPSAKNVIGSLSIGIELNGTLVNSNTIQGNYIGTDKDGESAIANSEGIAISAGADGNTVGGLTAASRNVISGNLVGVHVADSNGTTIASNFVGLQSDGLSSLSNSDTGIYVNGNSNNTTIGGESLTMTAANYIGGGGGYGIALLPTPGTTGNKVVGNFVGLNQAEQVRGNALAGIIVKDTSNITIGGTVAGSKNVIGGSSGAGVWIYNASNTNVQGNYIGTDSTGELDRGNQAGIALESGSFGNTLGGLTASARNVISGNDIYGVGIHHVGSINNLIQGNYIGTDKDGVSAIANGSGIEITVGASNNTVGGSIPAAGNLISGNTEDGISIVGLGTSQNKVQGNFIGTNFLGIAAIGNSNGITINAAGIGTIIGVDGDGINDANEGNLISGNLGGGGIRVIDTDSVTVAGNTIGLNAAGSAALPNRSSFGRGILLANSDDSRIGTNADGVSDALERNVIAGNEGYDVQIDGTTSNGVFAGNYIGLGTDGTSVLSTAGLGGLVFFGGVNNRVGTNADGIRDDVERNIMASVDFNFGASNNTIAGNYIGTDKSGLVRLSIAGGVDISAGAGIGNLIGGPTEESRNIIAAVGAYGVTLNFPGQTVQNNFIGVDESGNVGFADPIYSGIRVSTANHTIDQNVISGGWLQGILLDTTGNTITGNLIGTNATGTSALPNQIGIQLSTGASNNTVGGTTVGARNVISGNTSVGIGIAGAGTTANTILGNFIGTNAAGTAAIANEHGVVTEAGGNIIGGTLAGAGNVISGNNQTGVWILFSTATGNSVFGNYIGTNATGDAPIGNSRGVVIADGADANTIGGTAAGTGNIISGNLNIGVLVEGVGTDGNFIRGNFIGTNANGTAAMSNNLGGVIVGGGATNTVIGGTNIDSRNVISGNLGPGVTLAGVGTTGNAVVGNNVGTNAAGTSAISNSTGIQIETGTSNNTIGGSSPGSRNIISGNTAYGIQLIAAGAGNKIQGNYIGTDWTGTSAVGNASVQLAGAAIRLTSMAGNTVYVGTDGDGSNDANEGNLISGNFGYGIRIEGGNNDTGSHVVAGNWIGIDASGNVALPNQSDGVLILTSRYNRIGTNSDGVSDALEANVISGNRNLGGNPSGAAIVAHAITIIDSNTTDAFLTADNLIAGNFIGTNPAGSAAIANQAGIRLVDVANNVIGGKKISARNIISGNSSEGVTISGPAAINNTVVSNYIGLDFAGTSALPNAVGIAVTAGASNNSIGTQEYGGSLLSAGGLLSFATGVDVAASGDIFVANSFQAALPGIPGGILRMNPNSGVQSSVTTGGLLDFATDVIAGLSGNLIALDLFNGIVNVDSISGLQTSLSDFTNAGQGPTIPFAYSFVRETDGNFVVLDDVNNRIVRVNGLNGLRTVLTSGGLLDGPIGIAVEADGTILVTSYNNGQLIRVNPVTGAQTSLSSSLTTANQVLVTATGQIFVTEFGSAADDSLDGRVFEVDSVTGALTSVVGLGVLRNAYGLAVDAAGSLILTDSSNNSSVATDIYRFTLGTAGNVIGGNIGTGILIDASSGNSSDRNRIGVDAVGNPAPNGVGIHVRNGAALNNFNDNVVRFSASDNIFIESAGNVLSRNASADMGGLPIRLSPLTLSPGSVTITQVVSGTNAVVLGEVNARASTAYTVELFSSPTEGQAGRYVAFGTVTTDGLGFAPFSISPPAGSLNGFVHATLTGVGASQTLPTTSELSNGVLGTPAIILGLRSQSPEGTPITLTAFASTNPVTGYLWDVKKDGLPYAFELRTDGTQSDGGIQFTPDDEGLYSVSLRVTLADGSLTQLGPYDINVYNVAPTPSFAYSPSVIAVGTPVTLTSNNSDPGQLDILRNAWEVRYGSPTGPVVYTAPLSTATSTSFTPSAGGFYYVTMTVDDGDGGVRTLTREIVVDGLPASTTIVVPDNVVREGQTVRARAPEAELNRTEQLSFVWTVTKTPVVGPSVPYAFTVPSLGVVEFVPDDNGVYTIGLTISSGTSSVIATPQQVVVGNVIPRIQITGAPNGPALGTPINLGSTITDPGTADSHTVTWSVTRNDLPFVLPTVGTSFSFTPTLAGVYSVTATATDDDNGAGTTRQVFNLGAAQTPLLPATPTLPPAPPTPRAPDLPLLLPGYVAVAIQPPSGPYYEGGSYNFGATVPAGVVSYSWRARSATGEVETASTPVLNYSPQQGGDHLIELSVTLNDGRVGTAFFGPMSVQGTAPSVSPLGIVDPTTGLIYDGIIPPIYEGTSVTVRALATDPRELIGLNYQWELQKPGQTTFSILGGVDGAPADFRFLPTDDGPYEVRVSVTDSQGLTTVQSLTVSVTNADPLVRLESISNTATDIRFRAIATDPGTADKPDLRYEWSVDGGNTWTPPATSNEYEASLTGLTQLSARVTDDDGGETIRDFFVLQGTNNADLFTITGSNTAGAGSDDQILFLALDGDDNITIDASVTKKVVVLGGQGNDIINASTATVAVQLDGGEGNDTLSGGIGDDVLIAGPGTNFLYGGDGNNRFVGGGNDTMEGGANNDYYEVHFSTVVLEDSGGYDTIDLTAAPAGVRFDLSDNTGDPQDVNTGDSQNVLAGSTLAIEGDFEKLIGSPYADELTTRDLGTEIDGGDGNDRLIAEATGTKLSGGAGDDTIVLNNAAGTFDGGAGKDTISGTVLNGSLTTIATGAGDDIVNIQGATTGLPSEVSISLGGGDNTLYASGISGFIYGNNGASGVIDSFGSASSATSIVTVSNSNDIDIFGSASPGSSITVTSGVDIDIYGSGALSLTGVTDGSITSSIFGSASTAPMVANVSDSSDIDIFGSASPTDPGLTVTISDGSSNIDIFGSASTTEVTNVTVSDGSSNIDIFGSASSTGSGLDVTVSDSNNIDIFGSASTTGSGLDVTVSNSDIVDIFGSASSAGEMTVTVNDGSSDIDIFGSASPTGSSLEVTVSNSDNVDIFGSASTTEITTVTVNGGSSYIDIFGSASSTGSGLEVTVSNSNNVDIFGSASSTETTVTVSNSNLIDIFGSASSTGSSLDVTVSSSNEIDIFGSASSTGVTAVTVNDGSTNIDIFGSASSMGSSLDVTVTNSSIIDIFGSASSTETTVTVSSSNDIDIFGSASPTASGLDVTVSSSSNIDIFGSASSNEDTTVTVNDGSSYIDIFGSAASSGSILDVTVTNSNNIDIFGSASSTGSGLDVTISNSDFVDIFGSASSTGVTTVTVNDGSTDIDIFGSASPTGSSLEVTVSNSSDIDIFGSASTTGDTTVTVNDGSSNIDIFGSASSTGSGLEVTVSGSSDIDIFGSASSTGDTTVTVQDGSSNIDIFGSASPTGSSLEVTVSNSSDIDIFGSASSTETTVTVSSSNDIDIFGSASPTGSSLDVTVSNSSNIDIFGSASSAETTVTVSSSNDIDIFGSASPTGSGLDVTVTNSSNIDIFGSASSTGVTTITVQHGSSDIDIFGSASSTGSVLEVTVSDSTNIDIFGSASTGVSTVSVTSSEDIDIFGSASTGTLTVTVTGSNDVDIFGSASPTGSTLNATVSSSDNIDIFGSANPASPGSITVSSSQDIDIFGSASTGTTIEVSSSNDIDIYGGYGDIVRLDNATRTRVEGGVFGSASMEGITVTVTGGSTDIGIFGTSLQDNVTVGPSTRVGLNLRGGDDIVEVDGAQHFVALTDSGEDRVSIRSGFDMLIYLGSEVDQADVLGGDLIRIIGEAGNDEFLIGGGTRLTIDGGEGADRLVVTGGQAINIRGDAGDDVIDIYGGIGISAVGGVGNEQMRIFGSLGGALSAGKVYALLDGQDGDDVLEVRPLLSVADRGPMPILPLSSIAFPYIDAPAWMTLPQWITNPTITTFASSIAIVGGSGSNSIWLEGDQRLYGIGGDNVDTITLQAGSNSEVAGGRGDDMITVRAAGADNRVFGDQGDDTITAFAGKRLGIFGEEGVDTFTFDGGSDGFARGGDAADIMDILNGNRIVLAGEAGNDTLTIRGGTSGVSAGGIGNDTLEIVGGSLGLLLGQSGNDHLKASGGTQSILSGGDGDDLIEASNRGDDLYGDDGDDEYRILATTSAGQLLRLRELLYVDPVDFEPEARGSDTIDLSAFSLAATLNLGVTGLFNSQTVGLQSSIPGQLELILLGSLENIVGTDGNDELTGNTESNRLEGRAGNDTILGMSGDDVLEGGTGNDILDGGSGDDINLFATTMGTSLGSDTIYEATAGGVDMLDFSGMPTGLGTLDLAIATPQSVSGGLLSLTLHQSSSNANAGDIEEVIGTDYADTILGNALNNRIEPRGGDDIVNGREGSDIYVFAGRNLGSDLIIEPSTGSGRDTLDFVGFDAPVNIDLSLTTQQNMGELSLTLSFGDSIENVLGSSFDDTIIGNARDNALFGGAGSDRLEGRAGNDRLVADLPAVVLLDFDSAYNAARGDYNYSPAERSLIEQRLIATYSAFNWSFTQSEAQAQTLSADMGRNFVRISFSQGRGGGILGEAGEVDFRNIRRRVVTEVNINPLLPTVRSLLEQQVGLHYTAQQYSDMVVAFTATIAGHELAHTAGLRHGDSFGPIGSGYYSETNLSNLYPTDPRPANGNETGWHMLSSPASTGTPLADAAKITFFGEREAIKMAFNEIGRTRRETESAIGSNDTWMLAEPMIAGGSLPNLYVPNLAPTTGFIRSGQSFDVSAMAIVGDLLESGTVGVSDRDFYRFDAQAGDYVNIELMNSSIRPLRGTPFDGEIRLYDSSGVEVAFNDDDFEGTKDATIVDFLVSAAGTYYVSVGLSAQPVFGTVGRYELFVSLFRTGTASNVVGDTLIGGAGNDVITGGAGDDLILGAGASPTELDTIDGQGGYDTVDGQGLAYNYNVVGDPIENVISTVNTPPTVTIQGPEDGLMGVAQTFVFTVSDLDAIDANGPFVFTIEWGDGTQSVVTSAVGQNTISVTKTHSSVSANGIFTISASAKDSRNLSGPTTTKSYASVGWKIMPDPANDGNTILVIVGSQGGDNIRIKDKSGDYLKVRIKEREDNVRVRGLVSGDVDRILVFGLGGNDRITIDDDIDTNIGVWGGAGDDDIKGGSGHDILLGGSGNDKIYGGSGRDLIIGGTGADRLHGDAHDDILIAGFTAFDEEFNASAPPAFSPSTRLSFAVQRQALEAILAEWTSNRSYIDRRNNIVGSGSGTRENDDYFLKATDPTMASNTVFDDGAKDLVWGDAGRDWFFANLDGDNQSAIDELKDVNGNETLTDTDRWW